MAEQDTSTPSPFSPFIDPIVNKIMDNLYPKLEPVIKEQSKTISYIVAGGIVLSIGLGYAINQFQKKT